MEFREFNTLIEAMDEEDRINLIQNVLKYGERLDAQLQLMIVGFTKEQAYEMSFHFVGMTKLLRAFTRAVAIIGVDNLVNNENGGIK